MTKPSLPAVRRNDLDPSKRLEVRKARLLEQHRRRWAFLERLSVLQGRLSRMDLAAATLTRQHLIDYLIEIRELSTGVEDAGDEVQRDFPYEISYLMGSSLGFLRAVVDAILTALDVHADPDTSPPILKATDKLARKVAGKAELVRTFLDTPAWRRRRIRHLRREATEAFAEVEAARREVRLSSDAS